jgi:hypothetical protein
VMDRYTLEHDMLPDVRRAIRDIGMLRNGESPTAAEVAQDTRDALYALLGLVHDLADVQLTATGSPS